MNKKGYVLVRYEDGLVEPAVICSERYLSIGDEVMVDSGDTGIAVSEIAGYLHADEEIEKIARIFEVDPESFPRIIGQIHRDYWEETEDA